jgi:hypothetical protein
VNETTPEPFMYQPDPSKNHWVQAKGLRMERRGPCDWFIVGKTHDGRDAESQIGPGITLARPDLPRT